MDWWEQLQEVGQLLFQSMLIPAYSQFVSGVAKYGAPIIGAAIDFTMQVNDGANIVDAGIKTSAHVAIGVGAAKLGSAIGSALVPGAGTVVGGAIGFVAGVAGSMLFDFVYDNKDKIAKFVKDSSDAVVNTVKQNERSGRCSFWFLQWLRFSFS